MRLALLLSRRSVPTSFLFSLRGKVYCDVFFSVPSTSLSIMDVIELTSPFYRPSKPLPGTSKDDPLSHD